MSWKRLKSWDARNWEAIRDQEVRLAVLRSEVELRRLAEEQKRLETRRAQLVEELEECGHSEPSVRAHQRLARSWGWWCLAAVVIAIVSGCWAMSWYTTLSWERWFMAGTLAALPVIGWRQIFKAAGAHLSEKASRKLAFGLGVVIVLCSLGAGACLGVSRMIATNVQEELRQDELRESGDNDLAATPESRPAARRVGWVKDWLNRLATVAVVLLAIAGEIAAGVAYENYDRHRLTVRTVAPLFQEGTELDERLSENAWRQEEVRRWPALRHAELTAAGLRQEAEAAIASEKAARDEAARDRQSLWRLAAAIATMVAAMVVALLLLTRFVHAASASPVTVVVLDLSTSVGANGEFQKNVQSVEGLIRTLPVGSGRMVVLGLTEASFGTTTLLSVTSPREAGQFGEYLDAWRGASVRKWRKVATRLKPQADGTDLFGAFARAAVEFNDIPTAPKRLIILSDMRQVGHGFDFERAVGKPPSVVKEIERQRLVPRLDGVDVWVLGATTVGTDERQWARIRDVWAAYFRNAGATLRAFTPNHRLAGTSP